MNGTTEIAQLVIRERRSPIRGLTEHSARICTGRPPRGCRHLYTDAFSGLDQPVTSFLHTRR